MTSIHEGSGVVCPESSVPADMKETSTVEGARKIGILLDDLHIVGRCILADDLELVSRRILLMLGRHADVLSRTRRRPRDHGL
jgi:hypothetical protein